MESPVAVDAGLLKALVDRAPIAMGVTDLEGRFVLVNDACAEFFGRSASDLLTLRWQDLTDEAALPEELELVRRMFAGEIDSYRLTKLFRLAQHGDRKWGDLSVSCLRGEDGRVEYLVGQILDATVVEESRRTLASTLASMLDPHVLLRLEQDGRGDIVDLRFVTVNHPAADALRARVIDLIGASVSEVLAPAAVAEFLEFCRRTAHSREAVVADDVLRAHPVTGEPYWVDIRAVLVEDVLSLTWRDVTQRRLAEKELVLREERYRLLAENSTDVIIRSGIDSRIQYVSPSVASLGWSIEELLGTPMPELVHPDDMPRVRRIQGEALARGSDEGRLELRIRTKSGGWRWMSDHGRMVRDVDGLVVGGIDSLRDIQAEHDAADALERRSSILRGIIDSLIDPWVLLAAVRDEAGEIVDFEYVDANEAACRHNGVARPDIIGSRLLSVVPEHGPSGIFERYARVVETAEPLTEDDVPFPSPVDGQVGWYDNRAVKVGDGISLTWRDVTDRYLRRRELEEQAEKDVLTGVANRLQLERRLSRVVVGHRRHGGLVFVLYLDLDNFKEINDTLGHAAGDGVLTSVAARIRTSLRQGDMVARVGGDEFVVILDGVHSLEDARAIAEKIAGSIGAPARIGTTTVRPLASIGIAAVGPEDSPQSVIAAADRAMYEAKRQGRNRVVVAS